MYEVHEVYDIRHTEMYTANLLEPDSSFVPVEKPIQQLKRCKSLLINKIPAGSNNYVRRSTNSFSPFEIWKISQSKMHSQILVK